MNPTGFAFVSWQSLQGVFTQAEEPEGMKVIRDATMHCELVQMDTNS